MIVEYLILFSGYFIAYKMIRSHAKEKHRADVAVSALNMICKMPSDAQIIAKHTLGELGQFRGAER